jgi:ketosteroid isomerase-like protein
MPFPVLSSSTHVAATSLIVLAAAVSGLAGCASGVASDHRAPAPGAGTAAARPDANADGTLGARRQAVADTERAFADTMARRDLAAFTQFLAPDAVFVSGESASRGPAAITQAWQRLFDGAVAPFSWQPDRVEVQQDGVLAVSTGPVRDPQGATIGRFTSTWREERPGVWRIVLDIGSAACEATAR